MCIRDRFKDTEQHTAARSCCIWSDGLSWFLCRDTGNANPLVSDDPSHGNHDRSDDTNAEKQTRSKKWYSSAYAVCNRHSAAVLYATMMR